MDTTETINEIYRQTEHQRGPLTPPLLCTMAKQQGVYPAKRVVDGRLVNDYSQAQANGTDDVSPIRLESASALPEATMR